MEKETIILCKLIGICDESGINIDLHRFEAYETKNSYMIKGINKRIPKDRIMKTSFYNQFVSLGLHIGGTCFEHQVEEMKEYE